MPAAALARSVPTVPVEPLDELPRAAASDIKRQGWRGVMRTVSDNGRLLITNHDTPEAVILTTREYTALIAAVQAAQAQQQPALAALQAQFDQRLAQLDQPDAATRLRALMREPAQLQGQLRAGDY